MFGGLNINLDKGSWGEGVHEASEACVCIYIYTYIYTYIYIYICIHIYICIYIHGGFNRVYVGFPGLTLALF